MDPMDAVAIYRTATHEKVPNSGRDSPHFHAQSREGLELGLSCNIYGVVFPLVPFALEDVVTEWGSRYAARNR